MNRTAHHHPIDQTEPLDEMRRRLPLTAPTLVERLAGDLSRGDVIIAHEAIDLPVTNLRHTAGDRVVITYDGVSGAGQRILDADQVVHVRPFVPELSSAH